MTMSLNYIKEKIKDSEREVYLTLLVVLVGLLGFGLGRLSRLEERRVPITIKNEATVDVSLENRANITNSQGSLKTALSTGSYVASRTGNSYYLPWCSGVKRIKEGNKVWFNTKEEAERAGLKPASNCKGI